MTPATALNRSDSALNSFPEGVLAEQGGFSLLKPTTEEIAMKEFSNYRGSIALLSVADVLSLCVRNKPFAVVAIVTPEIAETLLGLARGRPGIVRDRVVAALVEDMRTDRWTVTGDAVVVSGDGKLLNGAHRLTAITEFGEGVPLPIIFGASR